MRACAHKHTHTHTHTYIYIYIFFFLLDMVWKSSGLKQSTNWLLFMAYHKLYETKPGRHMIDHEHNQIVVFYQIKILLQLADFLSSQKKFPTN